MASPATPLKDFQKSVYTARNEYTAQSIQIGILFVVLQVVFSLSLGRLALLYGLGWLGWHTSWLLIGYGFDRFVVPVTLLAAAAVLYVVRMVWDAWVNPDSDAAGRFFLTRPLWSTTHCQRLMALALLLPAILPIAGRGMVPRPGEYGQEGFKYIIAAREQANDDLRARLAAERIEIAKGLEADRRTAETYRKWQADNQAGIDAETNPEARARRIANANHVRTKHDPVALLEKSKARDDETIKYLTKEIATNEVANTILRRRGYVTAADRLGKEDKLLMRK